MTKSVQIILCLCCAAFAVSCAEKVDIDINHNVNIAALEPMAAYDVPVKDGFTTVVSLNGEQLAVTRQPLTISVPAYALSSRANQLDVTYTNEDIFGEFGRVSFWHYLSFEDTRNGDCDFNDVVLHCRVESEVPWNYPTNAICKHRVSVQPVALGGSTKIGFGFLYRDDAGNICESIVTDDIRRDLFNGEQSFPINTDLAKPTKKVTNKLKPVFECTTRIPDFPVVWFIQNGTDRLFAATTNFDADKKFNMINEEGMPYGITLTTKWCYPVERCNIRKAYPDFEKWLSSGNEAILLGRAVRENTYYPATLKNGVDGDLWDYEK